MYHLEKAKKNEIETGVLGQCEKWSFPKKRNLDLKLFCELDSGKNKNQKALVWLSPIWLVWHLLVPNKHLILCQCSPYEFQCHVTNVSVKAIDIKQHWNHTSYLRNFQSKQNLGCCSLNLKNCLWNTLLEKITCGLCLWKWN